MNALCELPPLRAGLGDLLPLLIFVAIWWVTSRSGTNKQSPTTGQQQASADQPSVPAAATDTGEEITPMAVLRQMLFGGLEIPEKLGSHPRREPPLQPAEFNNAFRQETVWNDAPPTPPPAKPVVAPAERDANEPRPVALKAALPATSGSRGKRPTLVTIRAKRRELQRAVAWSEVLAPPVCLRDQPCYPSPPFTPPA